MQRFRGWSPQALLSHLNGQFSNEIPQDTYVARRLVASHGLRAARAGLLYYRHSGDCDLPSVPAHSARQVAWTPV
jgi:hypothetical protein